jgi:hypothetical protein
MIDNGKVSTALISIAGVVLAAVIADPSILQAFMGQYYLQYGATVLALLAVCYNVFFPRNKAEAVEEIPEP